jgi:hypothetical protein
VGDDESDPDQPWQRELARRKGDEKGFQKGYQGGYKGQKGADKGYQGYKGKEPTKGRKGQGGKAAAYGSMWMGWGATGGNAAETDLKENGDEHSDLMLLIFCIMLVLMGMGLASRAFRKPLARILRWAASLIDAGDVSARVVLEPFCTMHEQDPASVGAMPPRAGFEDTLRMRGMRRDAAPAQGFEGGSAMPITAEQGTQSLTINGCGLDVGTQTVDKHFWLDKMTVYELKTHCKDQGLQTTGLKADLIWRIAQHRANLAGSEGHAFTR